MLMDIRDMIQVVLDQNLMSPQVQAVMKQYNIPQQTLGNNALVNNFIRNPQSGRILPQSPYYQLTDAQAIQDPEKRQEALNNATMGMVMGMTTPVEPKPTAKSLTALVESARGVQRDSVIVSAQNALDRIHQSPTGVRDYAPVYDFLKNAEAGKDTPDQMRAVQELLALHGEANLSTKLPTQTGELNSLNPTGNVLAKYNAKERASLPLGKNITSLAQTSSKSPDEMITIYRGVKDKYGSINSGDFITTNPQLAKDYSGGGKVLSKKVRLGDILDDVSEPLGEEYIYRPQSSLPTQVEGLPYYHATTAENAKLIEQNGFQGNVGRNSMRSHGDMQKGVFLYPNNKGAAETFGTNLKNPKVLEARINGKVYDANNASKYGWEENLQTQEIASNPKIIEQLRKDGYVGVTSTELGTPATFVFEPKALNQSSVVPKTNPLVQEASKYKSAEEFVTNQPTYYHQSQNKQITGELLQKGDVGYKANKDFSAAKEGIYFSTDKEGVVSKYGKSGGALVEAKLTPKKPLDLGDYDGMYFDGRKANVADIAIENTGRAFRGEPALPMPDITLHSISAKAKNWLQKNGYDLVNGKISTTGAPETVVLDKSIIKTKSQLTDIFNQSKGVQNKGGGK